MQKAPKILVVDDDKTNLKFLKEILDEEFQLYSVDSGEEALRVIHEFRPNIVLLDIMLPGVDGYRVCQSIKQDERCDQIKIILISAKAMLNERQKGYEAGADDYITKPFDHEELMKKIKTLLNI